MYDNPWLYQEKPFNSEDIGDWFGFVYKITNLQTGQMYIGRKNFVSVRRKPVKGKKRKLVVRKESDWHSYYGSSDYLLEEIEKIGKEHFKREILSLHPTRGKLNYNEIKMLFLLDVLCAKNDKNERLYYNNNILNRYYAKDYSS